MARLRLVVPSSKVQTQKKKRRPARPPGPPSNIRSLGEALAKLVRRGLPLSYCFDYLGGRAKSAQEWIRRGELESLTAAGQGEPSEFVIFAQVIRKARAEYVLKRLDRLHRNDEWRRELAILERRDRENFGLRDVGANPESYTPDERFL